MKRIIFTLLFLSQVILIQAQESVVCLHGFFRSYKCMIPMANVLRDEGYDLFLWDYPSRRKTIEQHADCLVEILNGIAQKNPGKPIHFVTHSLGGLIVRAAVNHPDCPYEAKIGRAVLLAPPNQGACLARRFQRCPFIRWIFGKKAGTQLLTYTPEDMSCLGEFPESMQVMVIAGKKGTAFYEHFEPIANDGKVSVAETRLNSPHAHKVLKVSHSWIMTSRESIALTREFLLRRVSNGSWPNGPAWSAREGASARYNSSPASHSLRY